MHETADQQHLSLTQAARLVPGNVAPNCVWRWCRRGVLSRSGDRIKLEHVRIGGKLFTTARWIDEFGKHLATADAKHFDLIDEAPVAPRPAASSHKRRKQRRKPHQPHLADVHRELDAEGL